MTKTWLSLPESTIEFKWWECNINYKKIVWNWNVEFLTWYLDSKLEHKLSEQSLVHIQNYAVVEIFSAFSLKSFVHSLYYRLYNSNTSVDWKLPMLFLRPLGFYLREGFKDFEFFEKLKLEARNKLRNSEIV